VSAAGVAVALPLRLTVIVAPVEELLEMVSDPVALPVVAGANSSVSVAVWPGVRVTGSVAPTSEKPAPLAAAELIVTAAVPVEFTAIVCVAFELSATLPKLTLAALTVNVGTAAFSWREDVADAPPALAVTVAVAELETEATVAVKAALVAPAATVTLAGTVTELLLLARLTLTPPVGAAVFRLTVQASVPAPVKDDVTHASELSTAVPVPLRLTTVVEPADALLVTLRDPVTAPAAAGANWMVPTTD